MQVEIIPELARMGDGVTVVARDVEGLTEVKLRVWQPSGEELRRGPVVVEMVNGLHTWRWRTNAVEEVGMHRCMVTSSTVGGEAEFEVERGTPRVQYERTYVLMPPGGDRELAGKVLEATWEAERWTVGGSADDAGVGDLDIRRVIAIGPGRWDGDLAGFFDEHYGGVEYWPVEYDSDYQLRGRLLGYSLKEAGLSLVYPTTHRPVFVTDEFGRWRGAYFHCGLDLRSSWAAWGNEVLSGTAGRVVKAGWYGNAGNFGYRVRVRTVLGDGREVMVRYAHLTEDGVYVAVGDEVAAGQRLGRPGSTGGSTGDHLHVDVWVDGVYADPALLIEWPEEEGEEVPAGDLRVGFNDPGAQGAGVWMVENEVRGVLYVPVFLKTPVCDLDKLDFSREAAAGIRVYVNVRYSWATDQGGRGTLPTMEEMGWFAERTWRMMRETAGVWGWSVGNEVNNPREQTIIPTTPSYVVGVYEAVRRGRPAGVRMAPGAVDPFYGPGSDCGEWFRGIWEGISGAEFVDVHGYIRGPAGELCWSREQFGDDPLRWQYLNYFACCESLLEMLPERYRGLPVVVSEFNHLWVDVEPNWGWVGDERAGEVVRDAVRRVREWNEWGERNRVTDLCVYRWMGDDWGVYDKGRVLDAVKG